MTPQALVALTVFVPTLGAFLLPLLGRFSPALRNGCALLFVLASLFGATAMTPDALAGRMSEVPVFGMKFAVDGLAVFMALVSSLVGAVIVLYSFSYISHYPNQNEYYFLVVLFLGSMMGIVFASHLILLYVFWELTAITSWRLIGFFRERRDVVRADKAFLVTFGGAVLMLLGFIVIYQQTNSFDLTIIKNVYLFQPVPSLAVGLILFGILSKSATLPFHTWLPDAGVAPSPVTALLHAAVLVKIGVYVYARLFLATFALPEVWHTAVLAVAAASALISACAALIETDLKRIIAYSTISQIGFIFLGLAVGNEIGVAGALLYILMHGIAKGGLFLTAGIVEQNMHVKDITKLGGLIRTMPWTALAFFFCALSVMGVPPFGGFFSKFMVLQSAVADGRQVLALVFLLGAFLTLLYLIRTFTLVFLGEAKKEPVREGAPLMVFSVALLGFLSLLSGILVNFPSDLVQQAVKEMLGVIR